jgi:hypothetical protein
MISMTYGFRGSAATGWPKMDQRSGAIAKAPKEIAGIKRLLLLQSGAITARLDASYRSKRLLLLKSYSPGFRIV